MLKFDFASLAIATSALAALPSIPTTTAAHEGHKVECSETALNGLRADIQSISDGDTKTTATNEVTMAEDLMKKNDLEACMTHMHSAREAIER